MEGTKGGREGHPGGDYDARHNSRGAGYMAHMSIHRVVAIAIGIAALAGTGSANAEPLGPAPEERLRFSLELTSHTPGTPTGGKLHFVLPDGPDGKPLAEAEGVFQLPAGTVIDQKALPPCTASDQELQATGGATCPPDSRLGPGQIWLQTGLGSPFDPFWVDDYWYYGPPGEIFTLVRKHGTPGPTLAVSRARIEGATFIARPNFPPGYPPGTKTVLKESEQTIETRVTSAGSFLTTPPVCPRSRKWISRAKITYEDGSTDTATSVTRCRA